MKNSFYIILFSLLQFSCFNEVQNNIISSSLNTASERQSLLDTVIYREGFPPQDFLIENLEISPIVLEGQIIHADSISEWGEKVVSFKIDSVWKGIIKSKVIKYGTYNEISIKEYDSWKKHKTLAFIKRTKKQKLYNYNDSIEYFPIGENVIFPLDNSFKQYMMKLQDSISVHTKSNR